MREKTFIYWGVCIKSCGSNAGEILTEYHVFSPALIIMLRISQAEKMLAYSSRLSYPGQPRYHHYLHLERKVFCGEPLIQTAFILYSGRLRPIVLLPLVLTLFVFSISARDTNKILSYTTSLFPHYSLQGFRGFTETGQGSECYLMRGKHQHSAANLSPEMYYYVTSVQVFINFQGRGSQTIFA